MLHCSQSGLADVFKFIEADLWHAPLRALAVQRFVRHQCRYQKRLVFGHHRRGFGIEQIAVFNGPHAKAHTAGDRLGGIGMRHHVGAPRIGFPHNRSNFVFRILQIPHRIGGRSDSAGAHDFDLRGTAPQLFPSGVLHGWDAVGNDRELARVHATGTTIGLPRAGSAVPVAPGLAQGTSGEKDARPRT